jgi:SnoaL-like domain
MTEEARHDQRTRGRRGYWAAAEARDWDAFVKLLAVDVVYQGPQTRERVRGRAALLGSTSRAFLCGRSRDLHVSAHSGRVEARAVHRRSHRRAIDNGA